MEKLKLWLAGKKTYVVMAVMVLYALVVIGLQGGDWNQATQLIMGALGLGALRNGIK